MHLRPSKGNNQGRTDFVDADQIGLGLIISSHKLSLFPNQLHKRIEPILSGIYYLRRQNALPTLRGWIGVMRGEQAGC